MLRVDTIHDIIETSLGYMYCVACSPLQITNVLDHPSTMHTEPLVIKPYTFPNPSCQAHLNPIPAINPQLNAPSPGQTHRTKFSGEDLEWLICLAVEKEPWAKPQSGYKVLEGNPQPAPVGGSLPDLFSYYNPEQA